MESVILFSRKKSRAPARLVFLTDESRRDSGGRYLILERERREFDSFILRGRTFYCAFAV